MEQTFFYGVVEDRLDPLKLGRCRVRVVGLHTEDKTQLPTAELPWAYMMMPANNASISGLGWSPTGIVQGTWCIVIFLDEDRQQPIILGTIGGIPQTKSAALMSDASNSVVTTDDDGELSTASGEVITTIIDEISEVTNQGTLQESGSKYHINAVNTQLESGSYVTYNINNNDSEQTIASATYDETNKIYKVKLLHPELYTAVQYLPFNGDTKSFKTNKEITAYFDKNF